MYANLDEMISFGLILILILINEIIYISGIYQYSNLLRIGSMDSHKMFFDVLSAISSLDFVIVIHVVESLLYYSVVIKLLDLNYSR